LTREYFDAFQVQTLFDSYTRLESLIILAREEDKKRYSTVNPSTGKISTKHEW
jgi:hypothetical protein